MLFVSFQETNERVQGLLRAAQQNDERRSGRNASQQTSQQYSNPPQYMQNAQQYANNAQQYSSSVSQTSTQMNGIIRTPAATATYTQYVVFRLNIFLSLYILIELFWVFNWIPNSHVLFLVGPISYRYLSQFFICSFHFIQSLKVLYNIKCMLSKESTYANYPYRVCCSCLSRIFVPPYLAFIFLI